MNSHKDVLGIVTKNLSQKLYCWTIICVTIRLHGEINSIFFVGRIKSAFARCVLEMARSCPSLSPDRQKWIAGFNL